MPARQCSPDWSKNPIDHGDPSTERSCKLHFSVPKEAPGRLLFRYDQEFARGGCFHVQRPPYGAPKMPIFKSREMLIYSRFPFEAGSRHSQVCNRLKMKAFGSRVFESCAAKSQGGLLAASPSNCI
jgi:hypothetical protein